MPSSIASWPLQAALYTRLTTHAATSGYTVTDNAEAAYPYIAIGPSFGSGADTKTTRGSNEVVQIDVWALNSHQAKTMMQAVDTALDAGVLDLSGSDHKALSEPVLTEHQVRADYDSANDTELRHGILRYRFFLENIS